MTTQRSSHVPTGNNGARKVIADWEKYHTPDNTEFDMTYDGPTGNGKGGKAVGCQTFFDKLGLTQASVETLVKHAEALESHLRSREGREADWMQAKYNTLADNLSDMIRRFTYALEEPAYVVLCRKMLLYSLPIRVYI